MKVSRIEWADADAIQVEFEHRPGAIVDAHGSANVGTCLLLPGLVIEGPLEELRDLAGRMLIACDEMEEEINEQAEQ